MFLSASWSELIEPVPWDNGVDDREVDDRGVWYAVYLSGGIYFDSFGCLQKSFLHDSFLLNAFSTVCSHSPLILENLAFSPWRALLLKSITLYSLVRGANWFRIDLNWFKIVSWASMRLLISWGTFGMFCTFPVHGSPMLEPGIRINSKFLPRISY